MWQAECGPKCRTQKQSLTPKSCIALYFSILKKTKNTKAKTVLESKMQKTQKLRKN